MSFTVRTFSENFDISILDFYGYCYKNINYCDRVILLQFQFFLSMLNSKSNTTLLYTNFTIVNVCSR